VRVDPPPEIGGAGQCEPCWRFQRIKVAIAKYEAFHQLPQGSATLEQVEASSGGVARWAAS